MITPAISVVSAVEGLDVATPSLSNLVVPIALVILVGLFMVQRFGTGAVGWLFGPVICLWFITIGVLGAQEVVQHPDVILALSPSYGGAVHRRPRRRRVLVLGAVVLCVTGAEALYADRGHFGAGPIRFTWFSVVLPAVLLNYLGQAALIRRPRRPISNPFYLLAPASLEMPLVVLATLATIIASQAALTGSYSVAKQAVQLGLLPRIKVVNTSTSRARSTSEHRLVPLCRRRRAGADLPALVEADRDLRRRGDRHVPSSTRSCSRRSRGRCGRRRGGGSGRSWSCS